MLKNKERDFRSNKHNRADRRPAGLMEFLEHLRGAHRAAQDALVRVQMQEDIAAHNAAMADLERIRRESGLGARVVTIDQRGNIQCFE